MSEDALVAISSSANVTRRVASSFVLTAPSPIVFDSLRNYPSEHWRVMVCFLRYASGVLLSI